MNETPNLQYIEELAAGSESFKQKLIGIMKREFPIEKQEFLDNYITEKYINAAENVHKLKHKIGMLGFEQGYQITIDFEEELKENNTSLYPKFIVILETIHNFLNTL